MNKKTLLYFSILVYGSCNAQEVIATQGETYSNANGSISYTIGEVITNTVSNGTNDLTQGFHQTNWITTSIENHDSNFKVSVFPNPTTDILNITSSVFEDVTYVMYDLNGKSVASANLTGTTTTVNVNNLETGIYTIKLTDNTQHLLKTIKLIKK